MPGHDDMVPIPTNPSTLSQGTDKMMDKMEMSFYWGKTATILFSGWPGDSLGMYFLAFFFVLFLAAGIEVLPASLSPKRGTNSMVGAFSQATIHAVRMGLAYLVMLSVMSFNGGIFIAAVVGHFFGFFFFKARALATANHQDYDNGNPPKM